MTAGDDVEVEGFSQKRLLLFFIFFYQFRDQDICSKESIRPVWAAVEMGNLAILSELLIR